jgi:hypothetical protein
MQRDVLQSLLLVAAVGRVTKVLATVPVGGATNLQIVNEDGLSG